MIFIVWFCVTVTACCALASHAIDVPDQLVLKYAVTSRRKRNVHASPELAMVSVTVAVDSATAPSLTPKIQFVGEDAAVASSAHVATSVTDLKSPVVGASGR